MENKLNYIFLFLGVFSILLAFFDFLLESDFYGGLLATAWGLLFIFFSVKKFFKEKIISVLLQVILIIFIIFSGLIKLINKL